MTATTSQQASPFADDQFRAEQRTIRLAAWRLLFLASVVQATGVAALTCYLVR